MSKRIVFVTAVLALVAAVSVAPVQASSRMIKGLYDEPETLYGNPEWTFPVLSQLGVKMIRVNLYWGGKFGASKARPTFADPDEPGKFDWSIYDRVVLYAAQRNIKVLFSIYGTPAWANRGAGLNRPPRDYNDLRRFAQIAATRYSGKYTRNDGRLLPPVRNWLAWNEPNNPVFLRQQYRRVGKRWVVQSAADYARICNAIVQGIAAADTNVPFFREGQRVACGATAPRGNNNPRSSRPSVSPVAFLRSFGAAYIPLHRAEGVRAPTFDAYAHHPYYATPSQEPGKAPPSVGGRAPTAVTLGNINVLIREVTRYFGRRTPLWITEYGYQTNPPDRVFGVSYRRQAAFLAQSYRIAKRNPRIDMFLWFLLKDEPNVDRWQSGFMTYRGVRKPAFGTFRALR